MATVSDIEVGRRLRELRMADTAPGNRTAASIAEKLGVKPSTYRAYEYGTRHVPDKVKIRIAEYYGQNVDNIFYTV